MSEKKFVCQYAVVQFIPYRVTGEFINAGIVLMCPATGYFGYRLHTGEPRRVTDFFAELPPRVYTLAMQLMEEELKRVASRVRSEHPPSPPHQKFMRLLFDDLLHERETIVRFGAARGVLTDDPAEELARQYNLHVDRSFSLPGMVEYSLE